MIAYDSAYPDQVSTATVPVEVTRNQYPPIFSRPEYEKSITENHGLGSSVIKLVATDRDKVKPNCHVLYIFLRSL